jgi:ubiquitin-protein ligase E3 C
MDVDDLRSNVQYSGGYSDDQPVIEMLWAVIKELNLEQQKKFLKFVTGFSRPPFCVRRAAPEDAPGKALDRLPSMNLLPPYRSK